MELCVRTTDWRRDSRQGGNSDVTLRRTKRRGEGSVGSRTCLHSSSKSQSDLESGSLCTNGQHGFLTLSRSGLAPTSFLLGSDSGKDDLQMKAPVGQRCGRRWLSTSPTSCIGFQHFPMVHLKWEFLVLLETQLCPVIFFWRLSYERLFG